jgi:predicted DNA-binding protein with PD1-like motif
MPTTITSGRKIMGRLAKGDDLLAALEAICRAHDITLGEVQAIGAVSQARLGYYHQGQQKYQFLELAQPLELLALIGNVSLKDGQPFVHAHVTLGDKDGNALGGHLAPGTVVFACEFTLQEYRAAQPFERHLDEATALFLWPGK